MNTEDYKALPLPSEDPKEIFFDMLNKQYDLMIEFFKQEKIDEERVKDFNINFYDDQMLFKDFAQIRICEELCETIEAAESNEESHTTEELIDSFNFFLELCLIYNYDKDKLFKLLDKQLIYHKDFKIRLSFIPEWINSIIYNSHLMCNKLKSRPWKGTQYLVDLN